jgi:hypothetical protein
MCKQVVQQYIVVPEKKVSNLNCPQWQSEQNFLVYYHRLFLGRSIHSPAQLEEFARFQESHRTRRAFLTESAEKAYNPAGGQWGSGLSFRMLLDIVIRAIVIARI